MAQRRLGFTLVACALALAGCVSPEELRREDEAACEDRGLCWNPGLVEIAKGIGGGRPCLLAPPDTGSPTRSAAASCPAQEGF
jgi:hypothetical protein